MVLCKYLLGAILVLFCKTGMADFLCHVGWGKWVKSLMSTSSKIWKREGYLIFVSFRDKFSRVIHFWIAYALLRARHSREVAEWFCLQLVQTSWLHWCSLECEREHLLHLCTVCWQCRAKWLNLKQRKHWLKGTNGLTLILVYRKTISLGIWVPLNQILTLGVLIKISLLSRSLVFTRIISCIGTGEEMYSLSSERY